MDSQTKDRNVQMAELKRLASFLLDELIPAIESGLPFKVIIADDLGSDFDSTNAPECLHPDLDYKVRYEPCQFWANVYRKADGTIYAGYPYATEAEAKPNIATIKGNYLKTSKFVEQNV